MGAERLERERQVVERFKLRTEHDIEHVFGRSHLDIYLMAKRMGRIMSRRMRQTT